MKSFRFPALRAACVVLAAVCLPLSAEEEPDGEAIIRKMLETKKADSELLFVKMVVEAGAAPREEHRFVGVYRTGEDGKKAYFIRMLRPQDVEGVTVLAQDDGAGTVDHWFYLPSVGKMRKLGEGTRSAAFLGSDFTYEDLLEEVPAWYAYERLEDADAEGARCYVVRAREDREEKLSAYAYRDIFIDQKHYHVLKVNYHGPNGRRVKTLLASGWDEEAVKGEAVRPRKAVMKNYAKGSFTEFLLLEGRLNETFKDEIFTPAFQEKWKPTEVEEFIFQYGFTVRPDDAPGGDGE